MGEDTHAGNLSLLGGCLCLDFANTVDWRTSAHPREFLNDYADLLVWSAHAGILSHEEAWRLRSEAANRPEEAAAIHARAIALREAIYRIFSRLAAGAPPEEDDLALLNRELSAALAKLRVVRNNGEFAWKWDGEGEALDRMLWPVVRSAADLLISGDREKVRECAAEGCGWLFVDTSRNRRRKWCAMTGCGNRAKARRYYQRKRGRS
ncbi:MAG: hypothetical protein GX493_00350 [Firmicutes bacterium]|nr:hypothetical protein [Bacillota bacterium]